jgi:hypothetical protein
VQAELKEIVSLSLAGRMDFETVRQWVDDQYHLYQKPGLDPGLTKTPVQRSLTIHSKLL